MAKSISKKHGILLAEIEDSLASLRNPLGGLETKVAERKMPYKLFSPMYPCDLRALGYDDDGCVEQVQDMHLSNQVNALLGDPELLADLHRPIPQIMEIVLTLGMVVFGERIQQPSLKLI